MPMVIQTCSSAEWTNAAEDGAASPPGHPSEKTHPHPPALRGGISDKTHPMACGTVPQVLGAWRRSLPNRVGAYPGYAPARGYSLMTRVRIVKPYASSISMAC